jgi:hypothetical protein
LLGPDQVSDLAGALAGAGVLGAAGLESELPEDEEPPEE